MALKTKEKTEIKPLIRHEITLFKEDILQILGARSIDYKYKSEGNVELQKFRIGDGVNCIEPKDALKKVQSWLFENGYLSDLERHYSRFEVSHHFSSSEDSDGCRHSVYDCTFKLWYDPSKLILKNRANDKCRRIRGRNGSNRKID